jgi:hypothetical protein
VSTSGEVPLHPRRQAIVDLLRAGPRAAGEISQALGCSGPTTSHHLSVLLEARVLACTHRGRRRIYCLAEALPPGEPPKETSTLRAIRVATLTSRSANGDVVEASDLDGLLEQATTKGWTKMELDTIRRAMRSCDPRSAEIRIVEGGIAYRVSPPPGHVAS